MELEGNEYETTSNLDSDALLPPRKRLLAGLKRQSPESSPDNSTSSCLSEFDARLHNLLKSCNRGSPVSLKEIAKAAGFAAVAAAMTAEAARAAAEEKAAVAAKAVAAAKSALSLVMSKETQTCNRSGNLRRNKHVSIQLLYEERKEVEGCGMDGDFARKLQRAMNNPPRISKHSPASKNKLKPWLQHEINGVLNAVVTEDGKSVSPCEAENVPEDMDPESSHSKEKVSESSDGHVHISSGRKRGRINLKELPLILSSFK